MLNGGEMLKQLYLLTESNKRAPTFVLLSYLRQECN